MSKLGDKIDAIQQLREVKRRLEEQVKQVSEQIEADEKSLIAQMDGDGVVRATGKLATVSISESIKPAVEDWDEFYKFIARHKYFHLLERRPSVTGCRELFETKGRIPGVVPFTQRKLNIRTV